MENNKNKKSVKFQGDMLNFCDFIQVFVFTRNHHLKYDLEFDRTSLKCMGVVGWGDGARKLQCRGVPPKWTIVGQGFIVLSIGA